MLAFGSRAAWERGGFNSFIPREVLQVWDYSTNTFNLSEQELVISHTDDVPATQTLFEQLVAKPKCHHRSLVVYI